MARMSVDLPAPLACSGGRVRAFHCGRVQAGRRAQPLGMRRQAAPGRARQGRPAGCSTHGAASGGGGAHSMRARSKEEGEGAPRTGRSGGRA